jgi:hypothetical protein
LGNTAGAAVGTTDTQTLTNKTLTTPNIDSAQFATVTGTAPLYAARAWVNFNGTGTVAIRESGNVSSITDNGTGDYTVNFTTAMPDANYSAVIGVSAQGGAATFPSVFSNISTFGPAAPTTTAFRIGAFNHISSAGKDAEYVTASVFR